MDVVISSRTMTKENGSIKNGLVTGLLSLTFLEKTMSLKQTTEPHKRLFGREFLNCKHLSANFPTMAIK